MWFEGSDSGTFQTDWLEEGGRYHSESYFSELWYMGLLVVALLVAALVTGVTASKQNNRNIPAFLVLASDVLLFLLRLVELSENDLSFYQSTDRLLGTETYLEIPVGFILSLIFGILDLRSD